MNFSQITKLASRRIVSTVTRFHHNDKGQSAMEILLLLFIAGLVIYFLNEQGQSITTNIRSKINDILKFGF
jgi:hypothetical protein